MRGGGLHEMLTNPKYLQLAKRYLKKRQQWLFNLTPQRLGVLIVGDNSAMMASRHPIFAPQKLTATQIDLYILWSTWRFKLSLVNKYPKLGEKNTLLGKPAHMECFSKRGLPYLSGILRWSLWLASYFKAFSRFFYAFLCNILLHISCLPLRGVPKKEIKINHSEHEFSC